MTFVMHTPMVLLNLMLISRKYSRLLRKVLLVMLAHLALSLVLSEIMEITISYPMTLTVTTKLKL